MDDREREGHATGSVVVAMPEVIDVSNSTQVARKLSLALLAGASTVIADFTATKFCDTSGISEMAQVQQLAADMNAELRLVVPSDALLRVMRLGGLDKLPRVQSLPADAASDSAQTG